MVPSDNLLSARRACSAILIPLLLFTWLLPFHARACGKDALCGDHIDAFFLPVITRPPPWTSPPAETGILGWRVRVEQQLVTGRQTDGGHAKIHARTAAVQPQKTG